MMSSIRRKAAGLGMAFLLSLGLAGAPAHAVLIDFNALPGTSPVVGTFAPVAVIDNEFAAQGITFGRAGTSAGVGVFNGSGPDASKSAGGLDAAGRARKHAGCCTGDIFFSFAGTTNFVSFDIGDLGGDIDMFTIRAYDTADMVIFSQVVSGASYSDIGTISIAVAGIHRVWADFDDTNPFGFAFDNLEFNTPVDHSVPEPSSVLFFAAGLLALGYSRWNRPVANTG